MTSGRPSPLLLPPPPSYAEVTLDEYRFGHPPQVPPGRVVFVVRNTGSTVHELILLALPDDFPPLQEQLRAAERLGVETLVTLRGRAPGSRGTFATELAPGRHALICFVRDADDVPHSLKGMISEFRVA
ncbi:MAG: hypothetical protein LC808_40300 [Actinobacteria bacterium]|nr:hypothetical protein [Actinomycetota bacterium]